jgi:hypothetical protein
VPNANAMNPTYWRARAATVRALISWMENTGTKAAMTRLAEDYDKRADLAHAGGSRKKPNPSHPRENRPQLKSSIRNRASRLRSRNTGRKGVARSAQALNAT